MNRERKILLSSIVVSLVIAMLLFVILVGLAPNSIAYNLNNYGWNGLNQVNAKYGLHEINSMSQVTSSNKSVVLEISPSIPFSSTFGQSAKNFVESGGTLVIADSFGVSNSLLKAIGAQISVAGDLVLDPVYNWKQEALPIAFVSTQQQNLILRGVSALALSNASSLAVGQSANTTIIAKSSPQSKAINFSTDALISKGSFAIAAEEFMGSGKLVVIGDSTFFLNSVWTQGTNQVLINNLLSNSTVYLDTLSWPVNTQTSVRAELLSFYSLLSSAPYRYLATLGFIGLGLFAFHVISNISSFKTIASPKRDVGTFNSETLQRVRKDREKYGTKS